MFKTRLYEVKTLFELQVYQVYLKKSSASKNAAERNQTVVLNGTAQIVFGHPCNNGISSEHSTSALLFSLPLIIEVLPILMRLQLALHHPMMQG